MQWLKQWGNVEEIEILPQFILGEDDWRLQQNVIGFSAIYLYKLHHTYRELWASIRDLSPNEQNKISLVALLATTEHLTAVNIRKELVEAGIVTPADELHTLDILLGSPLVKHSKSPMLWFHRTWLLEKYPELVELEHELRIVSKAAHHHPKNYYAWTYARRLVRESNRERISQWAWELCCANVSDVSMWSFLAAVDASRASQARQMDEKWPHESIKTYLRLVGEDVYI